MAIKPYNNTSWLLISVDEVAPVIACIQDILSSVEIGTGGTVITWEEPTATDNSGLVNLASRSRIPGSFFVIGTTPVTYRFVDGSANSATCSFDVTVSEGKAMSNE